MSSSDCDTIRQIAPELVLGIAAGEDRARVLAHLAKCPGCRRELDELSEVADSLLLLGPVHEPPVGFETRTLNRFDARLGRQKRLWRSVSAAAAALILGASISAAAMYAGTRSDRNLAAQYRKALNTANGEYFDASRLRDAQGVVVGQVFAYEGSPSWVFVVVTRSEGAGSYGVELMTTAGKTVRVGRFALTHQRTSWGSAIPLHLRDVSAVRLVGKGRSEIFEGRIHATAD
jgi:hypothetical protein